MRAIELFAGAGGLALGAAGAGFFHEAVLEWNRDCCDTIRENQRRGVDPVAGWTLHQGDVREFDFTQIRGELDLLAGGPPCQPFSFGGKHGGLADRRNMFPSVAEAARILRPRAIIIENVKGILRPSFNATFEYILLLLRYPDITRNPGHTGSPLDEPTKVLKAGAHGVPGGENMLVSANPD
ncbi:MAG: DNA cytosine methyltransferase [Planctomycetota bacterium]